MKPQCFEPTSEGSGKSSHLSGGASLAGFAETDSTDVTKVVTKGSDGEEIRAWVGTHQHNFAGTANGEPMLETTSTEQFKGGAGSDNQGFGEISAENTDTDLGKSFDKMKDAAIKDPVGTVLGLLKGDLKVLKKSTVKGGAILSDESYGHLAALAKHGRKTWGQAMQDGNIDTCTAWMAAFDKVVKAKDSAEIVQAMAQFVGQKASGQADCSNSQEAYDLQSDWPTTIGFNWHR